MWWRRRYLCSPRIPLALAQIVGQPLPGRLQGIFEPSMSPLPAVCQRMPLPILPPVAAMGTWRHPGQAQMHVASTSSFSLQTRLGMLM
jgi:hypothetical protein